MPVATMTNMSAAKWRVLNRLFFTGFTGSGRSRMLGPVLREQDVSLETLRYLEADGLIVAHIDDMPIDLADLAEIHSGSVGVRHIALRLTSVGNRRVTDTPANNVICMLGQRSRHVEVAKNLRTEGEIADADLKAMEQEGLIEANLPLKAFDRIPDTVQIKLTRKGLAYFPR